MTRKRGTRQINIFFLKKILYINYTKNIIYQTLPPLFNVVVIEWEAYDVVIEWEAMLYNNDAMT